jgi:hypothetical protein
VVTQKANRLTRSFTLRAPQSSTPLENSSLALLSERRVFLPFLFSLSLSLSLRQSRSVKRTLVSLCGFAALHVAGIIGARARERKSETDREREREREREWETPWTYQHYEIAIKPENVQNGISAVRKRDAKLYGKRSPAARARNSCVEMTRIRATVAKSVALKHRGKYESHRFFLRSTGEVSATLRPPGFMTLPLA